MSGHFHRFAHGRKKFPTLLCLGAWRGTGNWLGVRLGTGNPEPFWAVWSGKRSLAHVERSNNDYSINTRTGVLISP